MDIFPWRNAKICTKAECCKSELLLSFLLNYCPHKNCHAVKARERETPPLMVNFLAFITVSKYYHSVIRGFHVKYLLAAKSQSKIFLSTSLVMARSRIKPKFSEQVIREVPPWPRARLSAARAPLEALENLHSVQGAGGCWASPGNPACNTSPRQAFTAMKPSWSSSSTLGDQESCCSSRTYKTRFNLHSYASGFQTQVILGVLLPKDIFGFLPQWILQLSLLHVEPNQQCCRRHRPESHFLGWGTFSWERGNHTQILLQKEEILPPNQTSAPASWTRSFFLRFPKFSSCFPQHLPRLNSYYSVNYLNI